VAKVRLSGSFYSHLYIYFRPLGPSGTLKASGRPLGIPSTNKIVCSFSPPTIKKFRVFMPAVWDNVTICILNWNNIPPRPLRRYRHDCKRRKERQLTSHRGLQKRIRTTNKFIVLINNTILRQVIYFFPSYEFASKNSFFLSDYKGSTPLPPRRLRSTKFRVINCIRRAECLLAFGHLRAILRTTKQFVVLINNPAFSNIFFKFWVRFKKLAFLFSWSGVAPRRPEDFEEGGEAVDPMICA